jgi:hypothetical protein
MEGKNLKVEIFVDDEHYTTTIVPCENWDSFAEGLEKLFEKYGISYVVPLPKGDC